MDFVKISAPFSENSGQNIPTWVNITQLLRVSWKLARETQFFTSGLRLNLPHFL